MDRIEFDGDNGRIPLITALNSMIGCNVEVNGTEMEIGFANNYGVTGYSPDRGLSITVAFADEPVVVRYL